MLYSFRGGFADGWTPLASLIDVNGTLYGTTYYGGGKGCAYGLGCGTVYSVTTSGKEKLLYSFKGGSDGARPRSELIDVNGKLYGTTYYGGNYSACKYGGCGTVYSITTSGKEKVLYSFGAGSDGAGPAAALIDLKGTLYGTTQFGGSQCYSNARCGTVFSMTTGGAETVLYRFAGGSDGTFPVAPLVDVNGTLYGTTPYGGNQQCFEGCGTVFTLHP